MKQSLLFYNPQHILKIVLKKKKTFLTENTGKKWIEII